MIDYTAILATNYAGQQWTLTATPTMVLFG
jgi:hypothetical protein